MIRSFTAGIHFRHIPFFDAIGNLIYWQGNSARGINQDAVVFLQRMNTGLKQRFPDAMLIAEDSTAYAGTTRPVQEGGLGFDYKWDLGWMNDTLQFMGVHPAHADFQDFFRRLGQVYAAHPSLWQQDYDPSSFQWIDRGENGNAVLAFTRKTETDAVLVILNFSNEPYRFSDGLLHHSSVLFDTYDRNRSTPDTPVILLDAYEGIILQPESE